MGGHQGRARVGPPGPRPSSAHGQRSRRDDELHLRRGAALGLRRHRARHLGPLARRRGHRQLRHPGADRRSWVPECFGLGDEIKLGAYAVTEAGAGSDVRSLRTTAKLDGDEWVLNGTKVFITNGGIADVTVVVATVDPELGHRGQASFIVPKDTPGLSMGKKETKLGIRASQTAEVVLEDCRIPMDNLLGGYEKLQKKLERARSGQSTGRSSGALATFEITRPLVGASALGIAQAAYEWTLEYLEGRSEDDTPAARAAAHPAGAGRRGHRDRGRPPAGVARRLDGPQRRADDRRPGLDVEAEGGRHGDVGHHHADGPGRAVRPDHGLPAREVLPRRQDLPAVRGHGPGAAHGDLAHAAGRVQPQARGGRRGARAGSGHAPRRRSATWLRCSPDRRSGCAPSQARIDIRSGRKRASLDRGPWPELARRASMGHEGQCHRPVARSLQARAGRAGHEARRPAGGPAAGPRLAERSRGGSERTPATRTCP